MLGHGFRAKSLREPLMYYRVHGHGLTGTATMNMAAQAAKIDEANQELRTVRLRLAVALARNTHYVVERPIANLCRVRDTTPRTLVALPLVGRDGIDALVERLAAPGRALTVVTTADSSTSTDLDAPPGEADVVEVFRLPRFLDDPGRRDAFFFYLLESRAIDTVIVEGSEEVRRLLPEIARRFPRIRIM